MGLAHSLFSILRGHRFAGIFALAGSLASILGFAAWGFDEWSNHPRTVLVASCLYLLCLSLVIVLVLLLRRPRFPDALSKIIFMRDVSVKLRHVFSEDAEVYLKTGKTKWLSLRSNFSVKFLAKIRRGTAIDMEVVKSVAADSLKSARASLDAGRGQKQDDRILERAFLIFHDQFLNTFQNLFASDPTLTATIANRKEYERCIPAIRKAAKSLHSLARHGSKLPPCRIAKTLLKTIKLSMPQTPSSHLEKLMEKAVAEIRQLIADAVSNRDEASEIFLDLIVLRFRDVLLSEIEDLCKQSE